MSSKSLSMKCRQLNVTLAQMSLTLEEVACTEVNIGEEEHQGMLARLDHIARLAACATKIADSESTLAKG